jgi:predicted molibdopterin-dependent oxidoreductase YjgC
MGVRPDYLPGQQPIADIAARQKLESSWSRFAPVEKGRYPIGNIQTIEKDEIKSILIFGRDAIGEMEILYLKPIFSPCLDIQCFTKASLS